jgi:hypothetical protein
VDAGHGGQVFQLAVTAFIEAQILVDFVVEAVDHLNACGHGTVSPFVK